MHSRVAKYVLLIALLAAALAPVRAQSWKILCTGIDTNLRGISAAKIPGSDHIAVWASGSHGVILRSLDDGASWSRVDIPGQPDLDFRGIVAISDTTAYVMASGEAEKSRIYKTTSGGTQWELQYTDVSKSFFLDSIACSSEKNCFALGDPIDGRFLVLHTTDGRRWNPLPPQNRPNALDKEGAFAASNANMLLISNTELFLVTGGFAARVLHSTTSGETWSFAAVPIIADNGSSGIFAIATSGEGQLVAVGGDYANTRIALRVAAVSSDAGSSWQPATHQPTGYRSAVASLGEKSFVAVGPTGADVSHDSGLTWSSFPSRPLNSLFALDPQRVYAAGASGAITQFVPAESK
jgi:photosystem II stability/assembly factor-like uncharacterized protein